MESVLSAWRRVCAIAGAGVMAAVLATAQDPGTIAGTVYDQAGKALPGAAIEVKSDANGSVRSTVADAAGHFSVSGLAAGAYSVSASKPGFATTTQTGHRVGSGSGQDLSITLNVGNVTQSVTVEASVSLAAQMAPAGNTLDAVSAKTEIAPTYVQNFIPPTADFAEVVNYAPGTFAVNANGVGLGQGKTFFRGFKDGQYTMAFDGIPFQDTNDPTHHSWVFFPGQWIGGTEFDRSPGTASSIGPTNYGGSINLLSRELGASPIIKATASYGSFNTRLLDLTMDTGPFGGNQKKSSLLIDLHQMLSDGYQTYNRQKRVAGSMKYQYRLNQKTTITTYFGLIDLWTNTPDTNQPSRAQVAQFGDNFLLNNDPTTPFYYGYSFYHIQTDFGYIGIHTELGGWRFDSKASTYRYWNKQNLEKSLTAISTTSAIDKLNGANHIGDILTASHDTRWGVFRAGIWYDWSYTDRYQYISSPFNWADNITPNFHEHFITQIAQPFAEYEFRATPRLTIIAGIKDAHYIQNFNQFQDNGKTVGCLGGTLIGKSGSGTCVGGAQFTTHGVSYNAWLPNGSARYRLKNNWSVYAQFAEGSQIPPTSVFDTLNAAVEAPPKQTIAKTYQGGTVLKMRRWTLDADAYYIHFQNPYAAVNDPANQNEPVYVQTGPSNTKGIEAESHIVLGYGFGLYLNGTKGAARYQKTGLWVANAPSSTGTLGLTWQRQNWDVGFFGKRIGKLYNDNGSVNQAVPIDPFGLTNFNTNYTVKNASFLRGTKIGLSVNNIANSHSIVGVAPANAATASTPFAPAPGDLVTLLPGRSVILSMTFGYAPRR
jgi:iron complex outermembrane receptor protein